MQTFLTSTYSFTATARSLDNKRLNKQALEAWQIMMVNLGLNPDGSSRQSNAWRNHPATLMWSGCEMLLEHYVRCMVDEWQNRGYQSTIADKAHNTMEQAYELGLITEFRVPQWSRDKELYSRIVDTHRQALLVKDYEFYSQFNWADEKPVSYDYLWVQSGV